MFVIFSFLLLCRARWWSSVELSDPWDDRPDSMSPLQPTRQLSAGLPVMAGMIISPWFPRVPLCPPVSCVNYTRQFPSVTPHPGSSLLRYTDIYWLLSRDYLLTNLPFSQNIQLTIGWTGRTKLSHENNTLIGGNTYPGNKQFVMIKL